MKITRYVLVSLLVVAMVIAQINGGGGGSTGGSFNQGGSFTLTGFWNFLGGSIRFPEKTVATLPTASAVTGRVYLVTDSTTGCSVGSGTTLTYCRSNGSTYDQVGGSGAASSGSGVVYCPPSSNSTTAYVCAPSPSVSAWSPGMTVALVPDVNGAGGATTLNIGPSAKSIKLSDGTTNPNSLEIQAGKILYLTYDGSVLRLPIGEPCIGGTLTLSSVLIANATSYDYVIVPSGLPGDFLPTQAWVSTSAATFTGTLTASMGRTGLSTNPDFIPIVDLKTTQVWGDKPSPAVIGVANTYPNLVINFLSSSALGNGATSNVSAGTLAWGLCGRRSLQ